MNQEDNNQRSKAQEILDQYKNNHNSSSLEIDTNHEETEENDLDSFFEEREKLINSRINIDTDYTTMASMLDNQSGCCQTGCANCPWGFTFND